MSRLNSFIECIRVLKSEARQIFDAGVAAVRPSQMISRHLERRGDVLTVSGGRQYKLNRNVQVVAFGKAVCGMLWPVVETLADHLKEPAVASVPVGAKQKFGTHEKIRLFEGAKNNLPDEAAARTAQIILDVVRRCEKDDILIVLISGGGSALLPCPAPGITLENKRQAIQLVAQAGGNIQELNTIRKHLSSVKGGRLAAASPSDNVISFIVSDVIGDPLDIIAGAPTVLDTSTPLDCLDIISKLGVEDAMPLAVMNYLRNDSQLPANTTRPSSHVHNILVGNNDIALSAALGFAKELGYSHTVSCSCLSGDADVLGLMYAAWSMCGERLVTDRHAKESLRELIRHVDCDGAVADVFLDACESHGKFCFVGGGEPTVKITGDGVGGRSQQLSLRASRQMMRKAGELEPPCVSVLLCAGTDGQDGPTRAAGAYAHRLVVSEQGRCAADSALERNDSHHYYSSSNNGEDLLITGLTGTNVMDLHIFLCDFTKHNY